MYLKIKEKEEGGRAREGSGGRKEKKEEPDPRTQGLYLCASVSALHKDTLKTPISLCSWLHTRLLHSETKLFRWNQDQDGNKKGPLFLQPQAQVVFPTPCFVAGTDFSLEECNCACPCLPGVLFVPSTEQRPLVRQGFTVSPRVTEQPLFLP